MGTRDRKQYVQRGVIFDSGWRAVTPGSREAIYAPGRDFATREFKHIFIGSPNTPPAGTIIEVYGGYQLTGMFVQLAQYTPASLPTYNLMPALADYWPVPARGTLALQLQGAGYTHIGLTLTGGNATTRILMRVLGWNAGDLMDGDVPKE